MHFLRFPNCSNINICNTPIQKHELTSSARTHAKRAHARISVFRSRSLNGTYEQKLEFKQILIYNR